MTTTERELSQPVDLGRPDGRSLDPDARGWSRRPLPRANLRGTWGRNKRWDYWAILGTEVHQVFGTWSGTCQPDDGPAIEFSALQGFAEESRSRW